MEIAKREAARLVNGMPDDARAMVVAYDYTVLAGTQGRRNHYKQDRMFELANRSALIVPMPATTPSAGVLRRSVSMSWRWCCIATIWGQYSLNDPGSISSAMLSRIIR